MKKKTTCSIDEQQSTDVNLVSVAQLILLYISLLLHEKAIYYTSAIKNVKYLVIVGLSILEQKHKTISKIKYFICTFQ